MHNWDTIDIVDILKEYHKTLSDKAIALTEQGRLTESDAVDDRIIVIEDTLEKDHSIEWNGLKFVKS